MGRATVIIINVCEVLDDLKSFTLLKFTFLNYLLRFLHWWNDISEVSIFLINSSLMRVTNCPRFEPMSGECRSMPFFTLEIHLLASDLIMVAMRECLQMSNGTLKYY